MWASFLSDQLEVIYKQSSTFHSYLESIKYDLNVLKCVKLHPTSDRFVLLNRHLLRRNDFPQFIPLGACFNIGCLLGVTTMLILALIWLRRKTFSVFFYSIYLILVIPILFYF